MRQAYLVCQSFVLMACLAACAAQLAPTPAGYPAPATTPTAVPITLAGGGPKPATVTATSGSTMTDSPLYTFHTLTTTTGMLLSYAIVAPDGYDAHKAYPVLLALPPGGQTRDVVEATLNTVWAATARARGWIVISPVAPNGMLFIDDAAPLIPELLDRIQADYKTEGGKVHLAGISNGGISAFRAIVDNPTRFGSLTVLPGFPYSDNETRKLSALKGIPVAMFVGEHDDWLPVMQHTKATLDGLGVKSTLTIVPGDGHMLRSLTSATVFDVLDAFRTAP